MIPPVLADLFAALADADIPYVVLRGYAPVSEMAESMDVDVFIAPGDRKRTTALLERIGWFERQFQGGRFPHRFYDDFRLPSRVCTMLDVVYGLYYGDELHELIGAERVLATSMLSDGFRVPHAWLAMFTFALHVLLDKAHLSAPNEARARALHAIAARSPEGISVLEREYGVDARLLVESFVKLLAGDPSVTLDELRRAAIRLACVRARPWRARLGRIRRRMLYRVTRPARIAVIGMDGAGKGTLIEHAEHAAQPLPTGSAYLGYNQFLTRPFRWLLATLGAADTESLRGRLLDKLRELMWPTELYARMRGAEYGRALVLYDRYPFPRYERSTPATSVAGRVMAFYSDWWAAMLPGPDVLLFLDGAPEVLWARKKEYPFDVFLEGRRQYHRLYDDFPGERHIIATDRPLEESKAALTELLRTSPALRRRLSRAAWVDATTLEG